MKIKPGDLVKSRHDFAPHASKDEILLIVDVLTFDCLRALGSVTGKIKSIHETYVEKII